MSEIPRGGFLSIGRSLWENRHRSRSPSWSLDDSSHNDSVRPSVAPREWQS